MTLPFIRKDFKTHLTSNDIAEALEKRNVYNLNSWKIPSRLEKDYYMRLIEMDRQHFIVEKYGVRVKGDILSDFPTIIKLKVIINAQQIIRLLFVIAFISFPFLSKTMVVDGIRTEPEIWQRILFAMIGGGVFLLDIFPN